VLRRYMTDTYVVICQGTVANKEAKSLVYP